MCISDVVDISVEPLCSHLRSVRACVCMCERERERECVCASSVGDTTDKLLCLHL